MVLITGCSFNGPSCQQPPCCSFMNPNRHWLETITVPSLPLCQWSNRGHRPLHTDPFIYRWAKWQLSCVCVCLCVCVCVCVFSVTFDYFYTKYEGVGNVSKEQDVELILERLSHLGTTHTHTHTHIHTHKHTHTHKHMGEMKLSDISKMGPKGNEIVSYNQVSATETTAPCC